MKKAHLLLIRDTFTPSYVMGKLYVNATFMAHTLELAWRDNEKSISCIPKGVYDVRLRTARESASRDYLHLLVENVPNRSYILFHVGNRASSNWKLKEKTDTKGCILTGMYRDEKKGMIMQSKKAHTSLMDKLIEDGIAEQMELVIKNS